MGGIQRNTTDRGVSREKRRLVVWITRLRERQTGPDVLRNRHCTPHLQSDVPRSLNIRVEEKGLLEGGGSQRGVNDVLRDTPVVLP